MRLNPKKKFFLLVSELSLTQKFDPVSLFTALY